MLSHTHTHIHQPTHIEYRQRYRHAERERERARERVKLIVFFSHLARKMMSDNKIILNIFAQAFIYHSHVTLAWYICLVPNVSWRLSYLRAFLCISICLFGNSPTILNQYKLIDLDKSAKIIVKKFFFLNVALQVGKNKQTKYPYKNATKFMAQGTYFTKEKKGAKLTINLQLP